MIAHGVRGGLPLGLCCGPTIGGMSTLQLSCRIEGQIASRIRGNNETLAARRLWMCPSVDVLWDRHGKRGSQELRSTKLLKFVQGLPLAISNGDLRQFTMHSIFKTSSGRWWAFTRAEKASRGFAGVSSSIADTIPVDKGVGREANDVPDDGSEFMRKKKVALWVGYVGTEYKGLQIVRGPGAVKSKCSGDACGIHAAIEGELETAIYKAGGILESNYGSLEKVSWSRSSRTDKGVHSLSTAISMKMELPPTAWAGDPDGVLLAENVNLHLPQSIRIFGIVPVTKSFDARRFCCNRTYHYLLPAALIGVFENTSPETSRQIIGNFRSILNQFQGRFPYHNYTIRRLYRSSLLNSKKAWGQKYSRRRSPIPVSNEVAPEEDLDEDADEVDSSGEVTEVDASKLGPVEDLKAYWLHAPNKADKLGPSHFRRVLECSCGELERFGEAQFIRISITGESFMVHQIRKMVATAIGIMRGFLPRDIIPLSLCRHTRVILPLAPSEGLLLAGNSFYPYRQLTAPASERAFRESDVGLERLKELPKLCMTNRIASRVDAFWQDQLLPEIAPLLNESLPTWNVWLENLESQGGISDAEIEEVRTSWTKWREESRLKMEAAMEAGKDVSELAEDLMVPETKK